MFSTRQSLLKKLILKIDQIQFLAKFFHTPHFFIFLISYYWYPVKIKFSKKRRFHKESRRILGVLKMTPQFQIKDFELYYF